MIGSLLQAPWAVGYATLALIAYFCKSWQYIQVIAIYELISVIVFWVDAILVDNRRASHRNYLPHLCATGEPAVAHCK